MKIFFRAVLAAALTSVVLGAQAVQSYPNAQYRVLSPSECVPDVGRIVPEFTSIPPNQTFMHVRHMGDPGTPDQDFEVANPVTWDVSQVSGFLPPSPVFAWQRGYRDTGLPVGTSAFQINCHGAGFLINTWQFPHNQPVQGGGPNIAYERAFSPALRPWRNPSSELTLQAYVKLPWVYTAGGAGVGQYSFFYYMRDTVSNIVVAHVIEFFDSRSFGNGNGNEAIGLDGFTSFASSPLVTNAANGSTLRYATKSPYSASMQNQSGWPEERFLRAHVSYQNLQNIINDLRARGIGVSPDPLNYEITAAGSLAEVFAGLGDTNNISIGGSLRYFEVYEAYDF